MLPAPAFIFSDAHLGFAPQEVEHRVISFLRHLGGSAGSVIIAGDLFEFWFEWKEVIPRRAFRTLAALAELPARGVPVLMMAGNHDCWGGDFLRRELGIDYRLQPFIGAVAGWRTRIEHGDGVRPREDRGYRILRRVLRHPVPKRLFRILPPDFASRLAYGSSSTSRSYKATDDGSALRAAAAKELERDPSLELIVYGHSHMPVLHRMDRGVYANAGSWLDQPTFLRLDETRISLRRWDSSAEGAELDGIDRPA